LDRDRSRRQELEVLERRRSSGRGEQSLEDERGLGGVGPLELGRELRERLGAGLEGEDALEDAALPVAGEGLGALERGPRQVALAGKGGREEVGLEPGEARAESVGKSARRRSGAERRQELGRRRRGTPEDPGREGSSRRLISCKLEEGPQGLGRGVL